MAEQGSSQHAKEEDAGPRSQSARLLGSYFGFYLASARRGVEWLVAGVIAINALGFIVVGAAYAGTGVPVTRMPILMFSAAGIGLVLLTAVSVFIGLELAEATTWKARLWRAFSYYGSVSFLITFAMSGGRWPIWTFVTLQVGVGWFYGWTATRRTTSTPQQYWTIDCSRSCTHCS